MANISKYLKDFIATLKPVATSGSYTDLINKPTISAVGASGAYNDLIGKPTLGTAAILDVGNNANQILQKTSDNKYPAGDGSNLINVIASGLAPSVPYSVISAKTNANGYASFITKVSNTEISFDTNSDSTPITICYPDGSIETNNSLPNITGISVNGTYYTVKEKGANPYNTTLLPVESIVAPSSPSTNQLWLDLSVIPYIPKKWNGTSWVNTQFVRLGEFVRTSEVIGTPISYALNGRYESSFFATTASTTYTINHNIGVAKDKYDTKVLGSNDANGSIIGNAQNYYGSTYPCGSDTGVHTSTTLQLRVNATNGVIWKGSGTDFSVVGFHKVIVRRNF